MSNYILVITGEGPCPEDVSALLPWAKKYCKIELPGDDCVNRIGLSAAVSGIVNALANNMGWRVDD